MSCHTIEPHIVDLARGVTSDQDAQLARHVLGCPSCAGRLEQERAMSAALRRLADDLEEPAADPQRELALLALFDQAVLRPRPQAAHAPAWAWIAAAVLAFAAVLTWNLAVAPSAPVGTPPAAGVVPETRQAQALDSAAPITATEPPISSPVRPRGVQNADLRLDESADSTEFIAWPGAAAWPPFESGKLIRIDIPTDAGVLQADVLVDQDGVARAIRVVQ